MITMRAQVYVDGEGHIHPKNIEVSLSSEGFNISQGETLEEQEMVWVESEVQAVDLIMAIKAMAAAHGWEL